MSTESKNAKRERVRILNPPPGCQEYTSLQHARRYCAPGPRNRAEWVVKDRIIQFKSKGGAPGKNSRLQLSSVLAPQPDDRSRGILSPFVQWPFAPDRNAGRIVSRA